MGEGMEINASSVKELREKTGAGVMECKTALKEAAGDPDKALILLRERGHAIAARKASRETLEGLIGSYVHIGGKIGVLVEVNCESDFVARTDDFQQLVKDIAMQIAAADPKFIRKEDITEEFLTEQSNLFREEVKASSNAQKLIENTVEGKMAKFYTEKCLYEQPFIKDPNVTIGQLITSKIAKIGENIKVNRFVRFKIGETA